ncbi:MAG: NAD(P)/FAD-dependent oxidoreductase [Chloroflexi bacterium]|nr:NAD(P)/FAD-dependent oxidoreductase [Chloroflexota bacterium]
MPEYVIIGNSAGGIGAVEAIREVDKEGSLAIISDEPYPAYSRPLISEYLAGETSLERMLYRSRDFYHENAVEAILGKKVVGVDVDGSFVTLSDGEKIEYGRLLVATGGVPFVPKMEGSDRHGVYTFTTLGDAERMASRLAGVRRAVVIGGGLIGISVTEALTKRGIVVTVVELKDRILNVILDEEGSRIAEEAVRRAGVTIMANSTVTQITGKPGGAPGVHSAVLANGDELPCDLVVVAIGVVPRVDAVVNSAIQRNRGIVVDRHMATSAPNVYACGDVAEAYDYVLDINRLTPIWPNAYLGGRIAGYNMTGRSAIYPGGTGMNSLNYFGLAIVSAGLVMPDGQQGYEVLTERRLEEGVYKKVILRDDVIMGFTFVNDIEKSGILSGLMRDKVDVGGFKQYLIADDFDLTSLPKALRKARLGPRPQPSAGAAPQEKARALAVD